MSPIVFRLGLVGVLGVLAAVVLGRAELIAVALPALAATAVALRAPRPAQLAAKVELAADRCFEEEPIELRVRVDAAEPVGEFMVEVALPRAVEVVGGGGRRQVGHDAASFEAVWTLRPVRWGRWRLGTITVQARSRGLGLIETLRIDAGELTVFPPAPRARDVAVPPELLARLGAHVARRTGPGIEFAEVRVYRPGDLFRDINWPATTRRGEPHVNVRLAERATDVVVVIDVTSEIGRWGQSSLDASVRGAAAVCRAYLDYADRVGVIVLGGHRRWLTPRHGGGTYYRIVETLLRSRVDDSYLDPDLERLPKAALPPGAMVFLFTPLTDPRTVEVIRDLTERGHSVVVVDVATGEPDPDAFEGEADGRALALRIWRLDREALMHRLTGLGVAIIQWEATGSTNAGVRLDRAGLEPMLRRRR